MISQRHVSSAHRQLVLDTFGFEFKWAHATSLYRTFAVPRMAKLLVETGEIERDTEKRQLDTGLLMYELFDAGLDSDRGREVIRSINRMHHRWAISDDDYRYTLATFVVIPVRFIDAYGWRSTTQAEPAVITAWYREFGRRIGLRDVPDSYEQFAQLLDDYEAENFAYSPEGEQLMTWTPEALKGSSPPHRTHLRAAQPHPPRRQALCLRRTRTTRHGRHLDLRNRPPPPGARQAARPPPHRPPRLPIRTVRLGRLPRRLPDLQPRRRGRSS